MIEIRPATIFDMIEAHTQDIEHRRDQREFLNTACGNIRAGRWVRTFMDQELGIGYIVGFTPYWPGVGSFWSLATPAIQKAPLRFLRRIRKELDRMAEEFDLHRAEIIIWSSYPPGVRWSEALGFEVEAVLKNYGPDLQDAILMRRLFK